MLVENLSLAYYQYVIYCLLSTCLSIPQPVYIKFSCTKLREAFIFSFCFATGKYEYEKYKKYTKSSRWIGFYFENNP